MRFREDILRGVRLFAIAFTAILLCVLAYRSLHKPADAAPFPAESSADGAQSPDQEQPEVHPLIVPAPPPANGAPSAAPAPHRSNRPADIPVPGPPPLHAKRSQAAPTRRDFETPTVLSSPATPVAETSDAGSAKNGIGYKSLLEANPNQPAPVEPVADSSPTDDSNVKVSRGNRFLRALGKIFHRPKDEIVPNAVQPAKQP